MKEESKQQILSKQSNPKCVISNLSSEQKKQFSELKNTRIKIAQFSIKNSMLRIQKQKSYDQNFDQIQIQELFDQKVAKNINYEEYSSQFADSAAISKGKFSKNGKLYGTVGSAGEGRIWNTSQSENQMENNSNCKRFTQQITLLKADTKLCDITFHPKIGLIPAFAPNICTSTSNGELLFWTFDPNRSEQKSIKLTPNSDRINSIEYHSSGNYFLSSSYDKTWSLWDSTKLKQIYTQSGHQRQIHSSSLHPDGSLYFTADLAGCGQIWDLRTGKRVYQIKQPDSILCSDFNPNGYQFAYGGKSNLIVIKDIRYKKTFKNIPAHTKLISGLKYNPNQSTLMSVSHDNQLKLWHGRSYVPVNLQQLEHNSKVTSVDCTEYNAGMVATTTIQRKWILWKLKGLNEDGVKMEQQKSIDYNTVDQNGIVKVEEK